MLYFVANPIKCGGIVFVYVGLVGILFQIGGFVAVHWRRKKRPSREYYCHFCQRTHGSGRCWHAREERKKVRQKDKVVHNC